MDPKHLMPIGIPDYHPSGMQKSARGRSKDCRISMEAPNKNPNVTQLIIKPFVDFFKKKTKIPFKYY
jgi:hypothetical protein